MNQVQPIVPAWGLTWENLVPQVKLQARQARNYRNWLFEPDKTEFFDHDCWRLELAKIFVGASRNRRVHNLRSFVRLETEPVQLVRSFAQNGLMNKPMKTFNGSVSGALAHLYPEACQSVLVRSTVQ